MIKEIIQVTSKPQSVIKNLLTNESPSISETLNNKKEFRINIANNPNYQPLKGV